MEDTPRQLPKDIPPKLNTNATVKCHKIIVLNHKIMFHTPYIYIYICHPMSVLQTKSNTKVVSTAFILMWLCRMFWDSHRKNGKPWDFPVSYRWQQSSKWLMSHTLLGYIQIYPMCSTVLYIYIYIVAEWLM